MCQFGLRRVRIHRPNQPCTFYKLYINLYFYAPLFTEFELRKVFEKFNGNRSINENINKVHDLLGHASYISFIDYLYILKVTPSYFKAAFNVIMQNRLDKPIRFRDDLDSYSEEIVKQIIKEVRPLVFNI